MRKVSRFCGVRGSTVSNPKMDLNFDNSAENLSPPAALIRARKLSETPGLQGLKLNLGSQRPLREDVLLSGGRYGIREYSPI